MKRPDKVIQLEIVRAIVGRNIQSYICRICDMADCDFVKSLILKVIYESQQYNHDIFTTLEAMYPDLEDVYSKEIRINWLEQMIHFYSQEH